MKHNIVATTTSQGEGARISIEIAIDSTTTDIEKRVKEVLFAQVLLFAGGNKKSAARLLGCSLKTMYNKLNAGKTPDHSAVS